jgi:hypothetical protein
VHGGAEGELWLVPERKTAVAVLQLTHKETESSMTQGASAKLQHNDEHLRRGRRMVSGGGQCGEKTVAHRAHPGRGKTASGRLQGVDGGFNPVMPVSGQGPCDMWRGRWVMPPDRWPGVGLCSTDEWAPRDRISRLK